MTGRLRYTTLMASLIGGAMLLGGAMPATAVTFGPAFGQTEAEANVQQVRHWWGHRSGQDQGERYWQPKNTPQGDADMGYRAPSFGFGLDVPRGRRDTFGLAVPEGQGGDQASPRRGFHGGPIHR